MKTLNKKMTVVELHNQKHALQESLLQNRFALDAIPFSDVILNILNNDNFFAESQANQLVTALLDRDEPMTYNDIKLVFEASGFEFTTSHIDACNPDSNEAVKEQIAYYNRNVEY